MARPTKVNRLLFTQAIAEYITEDEKGLVSLLFSDREVAGELSIKLGIELNSEYVRNFRRSQNIASGVSWGGKREKSIKPSNYIVNEESEAQDVVGIINMNSPYATERLHEKCVLALSRMYGGGDMHLYNNSDIKDRSRGTGRVGSGGGIKNITNSQSFLARSGQ